LTAGNYKINTPASIIAKTLNQRPKYPKNQINRTKRRIYYYILIPRTAVTWKCAGENQHPHFTSAALALVKIIVLINQKSCKKIKTQSERLTMQ
jgi:hypothetical protein